MIQLDVFSKLSTVMLTAATFIVAFLAFKANNLNFIFDRKAKSKDRIYQKCKEYNDRSARLFVNRNDDEGLAIARLYLVLFIDDICGIITRNKAFDAEERYYIVEIIENFLAIAWLWPVKEAQLILSNGEGSFPCLRSYLRMRKAILANHRNDRYRLFSSRRPSAARRRF